MPYYFIDSFNFIDSKDFYKPHKKRPQGAGNGDFLSERRFSAPCFHKKLPNVKRASLNKPNMAFPLRRKDRTGQEMRLQSRHYPT